MIEPKYTISELLEQINLCYGELCEMNKNGKWPDLKPKWDYEYWGTKEITEKKIVEIFDILKKTWTLADVHWEKGNVVLVKLTDHWLEDFYNRCKGEDGLPNRLIPHWAEKGRLLYVIGEVLQHPNHFLVADMMGEGLIPGEFHSWDLQIITQQDEEVGYFRDVSPNT